MRLECGENLVPWLCIDPWILRYPRKGLGSIHSKRSSIQYENDVVLLEIQHAVGLEVLETPFIYIPED